MKVLDQLKGWFRSAKNKAGETASRNEADWAATKDDERVEPMRNQPPKISSNSSYQQQGYRPPQQPVTQQQSQPMPQPQSAPQQPQSYPQGNGQAAYPQVEKQPMAQPAANPARANANVLEFPKQKQVQSAEFYHYVLFLRGREQCKDAIGYIKSNAAVFLSMEYITQDGDRQRCVDVLSGAACALGCIITKLSPHGFYLISPPSVNVVMDDSMRIPAPIPESPSFMRQRRGGYRQPAPVAENPFRQAVGGPAPMQEEYAARPQAVSAGQNGSSPTARFTSPVYQRPQDMAGANPFFNANRADQA